jgi:hypothetical protein
MQMLVLPVTARQSVAALRLVHSVAEVHVFAQCGAEPFGMMHSDPVGHDMRPEQSAEHELCSAPEQTRDMQSAGPAQLFPMSL